MAEIQNVRNKKETRSRVCAFDGGPTEDSNMPVKVKRHQGKNTEQSPSTEPEGTGSILPFATFGKTEPTGQTKDSCFRVAEDRIGLIISLNREHRISFYVTPHCLFFVFFWRSFVRSFVLPWKNIQQSFSFFSTHTLTHAHTHAHAHATPPMRRTIQMIVK